MAERRAMRSCRLSDDIYLKAKHLADLENRSFNNWLENLLQKTIKEYEAEYGAIPVNTDDLYQ